MSDDFTFQVIRPPHRRYKRPASDAALAAENKAELERRIEAEMRRVQEELARLKGSGEES